MIPVIPNKWVIGNYNGTIGRLADIDDYNQSIERERSGAWILPLIIGIMAGAFVFAPIFAGLLAFIMG